jgi:plastocyanin
MWGCEKMISRWIVLLALTMGFVILVSACGPGGASGGGPPPGQTIMVEGGEFFYAPGDITAKPGERIQVTFKNTGTVEHTFVITDLNFKLVAQPGQTVSGSFTAPSAPGSYPIHCDVPGHTEAGMAGTVTVVAPSN